MGSAPTCAFQDVVTVAKPPITLVDPRTVHGFNRGISTVRQSKPRLACSSRPETIKQTHIVWHKMHGGSRM